MPHQSNRPCTYPGCNTLTLNTRCEKHGYEDRARPNSYDRGYDGRWTRLRNVYIRQHPLCEIREKCDGDVPAVEVDHKVPIAGGGARLDEDNLQSTCKRCHAWKTATIDPQFK